MQNRASLDALDHRAISFPTSMRAVGIEPNSRWAKVAESQGLGTALEQKRAKTKAHRAQVNARRKHSRRTR